MKELIVISGKGGTGKTSLLAAFAAIAEHKILCDADVDAADLHLLMRPTAGQTYPFMSGRKANIREADCNACGVCRDVCRFRAIDERFKVDPIACEGCGVCVYFCPEKAIDFPLQQAGEWYVSETRFGSMVHARLGIAEENSGKLVALVRKEARKIAEQKRLDLILTDGPPGVGCPVIASLSGADAVLIVTEPTVSGRHDMQRVVGLANHFKVPAWVCVNKFDLNRQIAEEIEAVAGEQHLGFVGHIPFDPVFTKSMVQGQTIFEFDQTGPLRTTISTIWHDLSKQVGLD
jgi:MinD superfamily P-loop ATPase